MGTIRIETFKDQHVAAAIAFNERLCGRGVSAFLLNSAALVPQAPGEPILNHRFIAIEGDAARGGFLMVRFPGYFEQGGLMPVLNCREPVSEGIIDARYSMLALWMLKNIQQQGPYVFALGMGGEALPFPRLLRGAGWTLSQVPFLFHIVKPSRFLQEMQMLRNSPARQTAAFIAAYSGVGALGAAILQRRSFGSHPGDQWKIEKITKWGAWADPIWERFRHLCSFSVSRDRETLDSLYPLDNERTSAFLVRHRGEPVSWTVTFNRRMRHNKYFGNLQVGSILDCVGSEAAMRPTAALVTRQLTDDGAELIVTNQSHTQWIHTFTGIGFLRFRSNYILALSKDFAGAIAKVDNGAGRMHFTRGDSDGRIFL